jgi:GT2 family glycosyltransferase
MSVAPLGSAVPDVSVIIPLHRDGPRFRGCLGRLLQLKCRVRFQVIVIADELPASLPPGVVGLATGSPVDTSPALKRDKAMSLARAPILAFLDDDAYPAEGWLDRALVILKDERVAGVGGPGLTPPDSTWRERLGGAVYESRLGSGPLRFRFVPTPPRRAVDDLPAYNLVLRRQALEDVGGWRSDFYGGEDTKLCLELTQVGHRVVYDPGVCVYHYRRPIMRAHLRQVGNVGRHRGYFVRRYARTSRRVVYFLPALLVVLLPAITVALVVAGLRWPSHALWLASVAWAFLSGSALRRAGFASLAFPLVLLTHHVTYGLNFIRGLLGPELQK